MQENHDEWMHLTGCFRCCWTALQLKGKPSACSVTVYHLCKHDFKDNSKDATKCAQRSMQQTIGSQYHIYARVMCAVGLRLLHCGNRYVWHEDYCHILYKRYLFDQACCVTFMWSGTLQQTCTVFCVWEIIVTFGFRGFLTCCRAPSLNTVAFNHTPLAISICFV